jgi:hypothetical protein
VELQAQCERLTMRLLKLADEFQAELDRVKGRRRAYFDYSWSRAALWESVVNFVCAFIPRV